MLVMLAAPVYVFFVFLLGFAVRFGLLAAAAKRLVKKIGLCTSQMTGWEDRLQNRGSENTTNGNCREIPLLSQRPPVKVHYAMDADNVILYLLFI